MATLACDLDVFAPSIPTSLAAIFLARGYFTKTRDMRALGLLLIFHLQFPSSNQSFCFREFLLRHHSLHSALQTSHRSHASFSLRLGFAPAGEHVQGATLSQRADESETIGAPTGIRVHQCKSIETACNPRVFLFCAVWQRACPCYASGRKHL